MLNGYATRPDNSLVGKIIATVLFGFLIVSFAIWGIGDIFRDDGADRRGAGRQTEISVEQFRTAYHRELQRLGRQFRDRSSAPEQARASRTRSAASVSRSSPRRCSTSAPGPRPRRLGPGGRRAIHHGRSGLPGPDGQFDRALFEQSLRDNGLHRGRLRARAAARHHAPATRRGVAGALPVRSPHARPSIATPTNAARQPISCCRPAAAGEIPAPTDEQLQAFYNERKTAFRAPEYRAVTALALNADALAKPDDVSDADARQRYEQQKASSARRSAGPSSRSSSRSPEEAEAALQAIKEGTTFEAIAAERNISAQDLELGTFTKAEMLDPAVAERGLRPRRRAR